MRAPPAAPTSRAVDRVAAVGVELEHVLLGKPRGEVGVADTGNARWVAPAPTNSLAALEVSNPIENAISQSPLRAVTPDVTTVERRMQHEILRRHQIATPRTVQPRTACAQGRQAATYTVPPGIRIRTRRLQALEHPRGPLPASRAARKSA